MGILGAVLWDVEACWWQCTPSCAGSGAVSVGSFGSGTGLGGRLSCYNVG